MVNHRRQATREIVQIIRAHNPRGVFRTEIPEDPRAAEAPSHGTPLVVGYARSSAARAYTALARELLARIKRPAPLNPLARGAAPALRLGPLVEPAAELTT